MSDPAKWPVSIEALTGASAATLVFRYGGRMHVTILVKGAFSIVHRAPMIPITAPPIVVADAHYGDDPARSVRAASELAPYLPEVDVLLTGHAYAPPNRKVTVSSARLLLLRDQEPILRKTIHVRAAEPFSHVPLLYELTARDPRAEENPVGVDPIRGRGQNLFHPRSPEHPTGFGPIGRRWPARLRLLRGLDARLVDAPSPSIPEGFDFRYFQAAPPDQRLDKLRGDEHIVLEGLNPELDRIETRLPGARGRAKLYGPSPELYAGKEIELRADTLSLDVDRKLCFLVWRASFPATPEGLPSLRVFAGVEMPGQSITWPSPPHGSSPRAQGAFSPEPRPFAPSPSTSLKGKSTAAPSPGDDAARLARPTKTMPFEPAKEAAKILPFEAPSPPHGASFSPQGSSRPGRTLSLSQAEAERLRHGGKALPFENESAHVPKSPAEIARLEGGESTPFAKTRGVANTHPSPPPLDASSLASPPAIVLPMAQMKAAYPAESVAAPPEREPSFPGLPPPPSSLSVDRSRVLPKTEKASGKKRKKKRSRGLGGQFLTAVETCDAEVARSKHPLAFGSNDSNTKP